MKAYDVAIIGAGAIGVSCALELARRGATVAVLEAGAEPGAGCSAGSAGLLCPSHSSPLATREALLQGLRWSLSPDAPFAFRPRAALVPWLARFAAACTPARERRSTDVLRELSCASLDRFAALRGEIGLQVERTGTLNVYETERSLERGSREAAAHASAGLRLERLTSGEAGTLEPALQGRVAGAIFYPDDLSGDPIHFVETVAHAAASAGATMLASTEAVSLRTERRRVLGVETATGRIDADAVVVAAGAWTQRLVRPLGLRLPVESAKGYHIDVERVSGDPRIPIFLQHARVVVTPLPGRLRLAGTLELTGFDLAVDPRRVQAIVRAANASVRGLAGRPHTQTWRGLRPCAPDGLPIVGRPEAYENLVVATAHAALGFTLAPVTGVLVAQVVSGEEPAHDLAPLSPDRFRVLGGTHRGGSVLRA